MKKKNPQSVKDGIIKFQNAEQIIFPRICIICGNNTENQYNKTIIGSFELNKDYKEDYYLNLPVCVKCMNNIKIQTGFSNKNGKLILISSLIGLILAIAVYVLTYSIIFGLGLFLTLITISYLNYKAKTKNKVKLKDFLRIKLGEDKKTLTFDFLNKNYAQFIDDINSKKEVPIETPKETEEI